MLDQIDVMLDQIDVPPRDGVLSDVERESGQLVCLAPVAVVFIIIPGGVVRFAHVSPHASDVAREGAEPRAEKPVAARAHHLVDHTEEIRVEVGQLRGLEVVVEKAHVGEIA